MPTPSVAWPTPQANAPVIGDDLFERFVTWMDTTHSLSELVHAPSSSLFTMWLLTTPDGALALRRINDFPRQHALEFPDDLRPWRRVAPQPTREDAPELP